MSCPGCGGSVTPAFAGVDRNHGIGGRFEVARCGTCESGLTLPFVAEPDLGSLYPSAYSPYELPQAGVAALISRAIRHRQGRSALGGEPLRELRLRAPGRVADIGCGRGDLGETLARRGWRVTGIEPSPDACALASTRGIDARVGTLATNPLEPGAYDAVTFVHSLEHVSDPLAALRAAADGLRPGGLVLISVPNFGGWQARRFRSRWYHLDLPRHRSHFTANGLARLLTRAGLEPVRTATSSSTMGLPASVQYALAGRCLLRTGWALRIALLACLTTYPLALALDRRGGGDMLHAVARSPAA